jgi:DNA replication protein DnaC
LPLGPGVSERRRHRLDRHRQDLLGLALAQQACRKGYRANYRRATRLTDELRLARADGTNAQLGRFARGDVLVTDDWGLTPVRDQERRDLLEVMEDRYGTRSTVMTSQLRPPNGTIISATRPWPTPSATASSTTLTGSR